MNYFYNLNQRSLLLTLLELKSEKFLIVAINKRDETSQLQII